MEDSQKTRLERLKDWFANHKLLSIVFLLALGVIYLANFTDAISKIWDFKSRLTGSNSSVQLQGRLLTGLRFAGPGLAFGQGHILFKSEPEYGGKFIEIEDAIFVELTNVGEKPGHFTSYAVEVQVNEEWKRLILMGGWKGWYDTSKFYLIKSNDFRRALNLDFSKNNFDNAARGKMLSPGETIGGWIFFDWPQELQGGAYHLQSWRMMISDTYGNQYIVKLGRPAKLGEGSTDLNIGSVVVGSNGLVDISALAPKAN